MHHFDGTAGEAERHGPEGALTAPVGDYVEGRADVKEGGREGLVTMETLFLILLPSTQEGEG